MVFEAVDTDISSAGSFAVQPTTTMMRSNIQASRSHRGDSKVLSCI
jgi:hypothetical protein